ncbi:hypothetical protein [Winogradskyella sp. R77965]|uniref:hypothetical protein n=1 Tax=Winogradskyella sp. R77965 TaxID=3093872 RepID=UPI0037DD672A
MKKFILKVMFFFTSLFFVCVLADFWISNILANSESYAMGDSKIWNDIIESNIDADLLIYGSSRAWVHFDPEFIEGETSLKSYNFGVDGHAFATQNLRHNLFIKYNPKPKVILYSIDVGTFDRSKGLYNDEQFLPFFRETYINDFTKNYKNFSLSDYNIPLIRYVGRRKAINTFLKHIIDWPQQKIRKNGFASKDKTWNTDFDKAKVEKGSYYKSINKELVKRFDDFLIDAKENNIHVILMYAPEHILGQSFVNNRHEVLKVFDSISKKNQIPFFDYTSHSMNSDKDFFYNSSHLNTKGVEVFNTLYIGDLKTYLDSILANKNKSGFN